MRCGVQVRLPGCGTQLVCRPCCTPVRLSPRLARTALTVRASASDEGPREVSLVRRVPGAGYTFMLAGALKIMTIGWVATGAPRECVRTVAGQYASFLLLPIGLLLCFIAKKIVDSGLHENGRFMAFLMGFIAFMYFALYGILYRYQPSTLQAQQRIQAAATHARTSPYADDTASSRRNKFIIQRQLEGEYDTYNSAYFMRAPEMQMDEVEERMGRLPAGMVAGADGEAGVSRGVGPTLAERRSGLGSLQAQRGAAAAARRAAVPSMYEKTGGLPGLDDESDF